MYPVGATPCGCPAPTPSRHNRGCEELWHSSSAWNFLSSRRSPPFSPRVIFWVFLPILAETGAAELSMKAPLYGTQDTGERHDRKFSLRQEKSMQKKTVVAIAVVVSVLTGYGFGPDQGPTEGFANEPSPTGAASSPQTDLDCMAELVRGEGPIRIEGVVISGDGPTTSAGCTMEGPGWLKDTRDYCLEKGASIKCENGPEIIGPKTGNYDEDLKKATDSK